MCSLYVLSVFLVCFLYVYVCVLSVVGVLSVCAYCKCMYLVCVCVCLECVLSVFV